MKKWYEKSGPEGDIVISTRIRLARNLKKYPFPARMNQKQKNTLIEEVKKALTECESTLSASFAFLPLKELSKAERVSLVERRLCAPDFISSPEGRAVFLSEDECISVLVGGEDHLRLQVMCEGLNLSGALSTADSLDSLLYDRLDFAFDKKLGYLTSSPADLGTGMRSSLFLHLPALAQNGVAARIASSLSKLGLSMSGPNGEGMSPAGGIYQLSNRVTLGLSEREAADNLESIARQLLTQERTAQKELTDDLSVQDTISRSCAILQSAKLLSTDEFIKLAANIRLGIATGQIKKITHEDVNRLMIGVQPATLSLTQGEELTSAQRDALRAEKVREVFTA